MQKKLKLLSKTLAGLMLAISIPLGEQPKIASAIDFCAYYNLSDEIIYDRINKVRPLKSSAEILEKNYVKEVSFDDYMKQPESDTHPKLPKKDITSYTIHLSSFGIVAAFGAGKLIPNSSRKPSVVHKSKLPLVIQLGCYGDGRLVGVNIDTKRIPSVLLSENLRNHQCICTEFGNVLVIKDEDIKNLSNGQHYMQLFEGDPFGYVALDTFFFDLQD